MIIIGNYLKYHLTHASVSRAIKNEMNCIEYSMNNLPSQFQWHIYIHREETKTEARKIIL